MLLVDVLKVVAFIAACGFLSGFIPGVGSWMKAVVSFIFNLGENFARSINPMVKKGKTLEKDSTEKE
jgi:ribose/xylose/arabinose/galactoside ABC-type transport system permease subunit